MDTSLLLFILGSVLILAASFLETFCTFGRQARPDVKPGILRGKFRWVLETLWIMMLIAGGIILLLFGILTGLLILALIGIVGFWLILPFIITPILRYRLLPQWDDVKKELAPKGYTERDYWRGDWWMMENKKKKKKVA